jgi:flagellar basal-body rod protein FlgF
MPSRKRQHKEFKMAETIAQVTNSANALMREFDVITHNIANVSTNGYKRICNAFSKSLEAQEAGLNINSTENSELSSSIDFSQGNIVETGRPLDFALYGKGFFVLETPNGPLYSRNGIFHTNQNGQIVNSSGMIVAGQNGQISIPGNIALSELNMSADGNINAKGSSIGKFKIVDFKDNESKLIPAGQNCYKISEDIKPADAENIVVRQGYQEASNVKLIDELVDMIMVCRLYEANMKVVSSQGDTSSSIIDVAMG